MRVSLPPGEERLEEEGEEDQQLVSPRTPDATVDPMVSHVAEVYGHL
jgi:hypothetical protein